MSALDELVDYIKFGPADLELLQAAAPRLLPHLRGMADAFYAAIEANPKAGTVLREGPKQVSQLKLSLERWATDLLTRPRDAVYAESRRRIGVKHADLGLDQRWVMAAMGVVRGYLKRRIREELFDNPMFQAMLDALDRALDLDAALLSISYVDSANERRLAERDAEDRAIRKIQSLLVSGYGRLVNLGEVREALVRVLPVDQVVVLVDRPRASGLEVVGVDGRFPLASLVPGVVVPYAEGGLAQVLETGVQRTYELDDRGSTINRELFRSGLRALTVLPLWVEDRVVGALLLAARAAGSARTEFLLAVADAVALAVARHEDALRLFDSEEQFRSLFDAVADGLFVLDADGRYRVCNAVFAKLLDRGRDDVVGRTVDELFPPDGAQRLKALEADARALGRPVSGELAVEVGSRRRWLALTLAPVRSASGDVAALTGTARDTTAERERTAHQAHQHKMTSLGLLAAGIAHEVSNPLASIACIAQDLEETTADEESKDLLRRIVTSTQRASRSLHQVLKFVRPTARDAAPVPVNETVTQTLEMASFDPRARGISFAMQLAPDLPPARASADDVSQIVLNLLLNALDAMSLKLGPPSERPPAPRLAQAGPGQQAHITVRTWATGDSVRVEVEDHGPGIPRDQIARIFEPFYSTKSAGRGTGLGLFVSAEIVRDLGGSLDVDSVPGEGARFTLKLPR